MNTHSELMKTLAALIVGALCVAAPAQATSLQDSERMLAACLDYATGQKYPPMSIGVIDASGTLVAFKRQDGASQATAEAALLKARTSMRLQAPTAVLGPLAASDARYRDSFIMMQMTTLAGGVPIADTGGRVVGAIGVSGGLAEQDVQCAEKALESRQLNKR